MLQKNEEKKAPKKGMRTRAALRQVAASEFARLGYHNTKISDIVARAGVSQPVFYTYFESKEAAYDELIGEFRANLQAVTQTVLIQPNTAPDGGVDEVTRGLRMFLDFLAVDRDLTEIGFFQPPGSIATRQQLASWISANVAQEQGSGLFRSDISSKRIASFFVGMIDQMAREGAGAKKRQEMAREGALMICEGLWLKR